MDKETWKRHIEEITGLIRPSHGGSIEEWAGALRSHDTKNCPVCKARAKTKRHSSNAKATRAAYRDLGMHRVIGAETGSVYYE